MENSSRVCQAYILPFKNLSSEASGLAPYVAIRCGSLHLLSLLGTVHLALNWALSRANHGDNDEPFFLRTLFLFVLLIHS